MASLPSSRRVTYEEWLRMPEVATKQEVVNGEIHIRPALKLNHALVVQSLYDELRRQVDPKQVLVLSSIFGLVRRCEPLTTREPDLAAFQMATIVERDGYIHSPPQLIGEVLRPGNSRHEMQEKLDDYASLGVPEVWLVFPEARTIEVLQLQDGQLRHLGVYAQGSLKPREVPDVQVDISRIWPD